jgi:hypothetical protein
MKNKGSKQQQGGSPYLLDRNLTPRIEQYALNHDIRDIDEVVDYLRRSYKEYQRKQVAALRQMVTKAVQVVQQKGVAKPEVQLQVRKRRFLRLGNMTFRAVPSWGFRSSVGGPGCCSCLGPDGCMLRPRTGARCSIA